MRETHRRSDQRVLCGDFNVVPEDRDNSSAAPSPRALNYTHGERRRFPALRAGLTDLYAHLHRDGHERFTYWPYARNRESLRFGVRLDLMLATKRVVDRVRNVWVDMAYRRVIDDLQPSESAPVVPSRTTAPTRCPWPTACTMNSGRCSPRRRSRPLTRPFSGCRQGTAMTTKLRPTRPLPPQSSPEICRELGVRGVAAVEQCPACREYRASVSGGSLVEGHEERRVVGQRGEDRIGILAWIVGEVELGGQQRSPVQLDLHVDVPRAGGVVARSARSQAVRPPARREVSRARSRDCPADAAPCPITPPAAAASITTCIRRAVVRLRSGRDRAISPPCYRRRTLYLDSVCLPAASR